MKLGRSPDPERDWWRTAVVYQVYPRSFADSDGDGIGDLPGVRSRLGHLVDLGIDAIWLSPFYPSPQADGGYDITDYRDVDPALGTLADFTALTAEAHLLGVRVIIDIVPNHTSVQHPWFREALAAAPGSPARERYIFRDGRGPGGAEPPSDRRSQFGAGAWERVADGQWYCHLFASEQPDLNWGHPEVRAYFMETLRFWADRGADGFRIDVAHSLVKDLSEPPPDRTRPDPRRPDDGSDLLRDRQEVRTIYREWRSVFDEHTPTRTAAAETRHPVSERTFVHSRLAELGQVFDFSLIRSRWDGDSFRFAVHRSVDNHARSGGPPAWVLSSHDVPRHASRLALPPGVDPDDWLMSDGENPRIEPHLGLRRARAATLMMLALPGSAYLYQGEELGLPEVADLPSDVLHDPVFRSSGGLRKGRDGCRVPLPWNRSGPSLGFGPGEPWLPQPPWFAGLSVEAQSASTNSTLSFYRRALWLRRALPELDVDDFHFTRSPPGVLVFRRGGNFVCLLNMSDRPYPLPPGRVLMSSASGIPAPLPPDAAVWLLETGDAATT